MKKLVQFGAGNIGRSFIGQLFARAGYEVVFVDVDASLVQALNAAGRYRVVIKRNDEPDETLWVEGVRAVDGRDREAVAREVAEAAYVATAVGKSAIPRIVAPVADGVRRRFAAGADAGPLDIIFAENVKDVAAWFAGELASALPAGAAALGRVGLVETSIGKMVPIMTEEDRKRDPLWVFAESYNTLIVDRKGFKGRLPDIPTLEAVENIRAYVDRKLYIHNLGHAAAAYLGHRERPDAPYIHQVLEERERRERVRETMRQSARALAREYPDDLPARELDAHVEDLLDRFRNRSLNDTVFRVGRDIRRKLARNDRIAGAMLLCARRGVPFGRIAAVYVAALSFRAVDERGAVAAEDRAFHEEVSSRGPDAVLDEVSLLDPRDPVDSDVRRAVREAWRAG